MGDGFLLNPEAVTQRFLTENKQLPWQTERMWEFILRPLRLVFYAYGALFLAMSRRYRARVDREIPSNFAVRRWF